MDKVASGQIAVRRLRGIVSVVLLGFLSSCGFNPFCPVERYSYREMVPVYLQPGEITRVESLAPRAIKKRAKSTCTVT